MAYTSRTRMWVATSFSVRPSVCPRPPHAQSRLRTALSGINARQRIWRRGRECRLFSAMVVCGSSFSRTKGPQREPRHVHVKGGGGDAKRLEPEVALAESYRFNSSELARILRVVAEQRDLILRHGMKISATAVRFDEHTMWVDLTDGRTLGCPRSLGFRACCAQTRMNAAASRSAGRACIGKISTKIFRSQDCSQAAAT